jgi:hypothetical protein
MTVYKQPNKKESQYIIGNTGEDGVARHYNAVRSEDWYDPTKDGHIKDLSYEVKTLRLNYHYGAFWIDKSQFKKLDNCDILFFVRIPENKNQRANIFLFMDHKNSWEKAYDKNGVGFRLYPIKRCIKIADLTEEESLTLLHHSINISKHNRFEVNVEL